MQSPQQTPEPEQIGPYLSLTVTDEQWTMHFYKYDLATKKMEEVAQAPATAQYSLGTIDQRTRTLNYVERDSKGTDQLVKLDLNTGKKDYLFLRVHTGQIFIPT